MIPYGSPPLLKRCKIQISRTFPDIGAISWLDEFTVYG